MTAEATVSTRDRVRGVANAALSGKGIFIALAVILIAAAILAPNFYAGVNVGNTLRRASILGIITVGQVFVLMVRGVDLSVAAMAGITAIAVTTLDSSAVGILAALGIAVLVGSANAWLVVRRGVPAFVATFGMVLVLTGAQLLWTRGGVSAQAPADLIGLARGSLGPIAIPVLLWLLATAASTWWTSRTPSGRRLVLSGANPRMAQLSGIAVGGKQWLAFVISAVLAVIGGALLTGFSGYVDRSIGSGLELDSITAALLGGARFKGGEGSFVAALGGVLVLSALSTLVVVLGLRPETQNILKGVVLILALTLHLPARRR
ncbi:MAG: transporter permease [Naasia sp.]|jgi:ribose transport system permease protein|uniref:ABC transporter permease n=1 Tax=Naasia sp. TaxID=2546198 RepID=UPI002632FE68|nr:ABC transporter permease [Naasia sp.]MCU1570606.1 transporter permease [Naasia sp.]